MKSKIFILAIATILIASFSSAEIYYDTRPFVENNPDGRKYEFVSSYLLGLNYVRNIENRRKDEIVIDFDDEEIYQKVSRLKGFLIKDNANWRVARNLMKKYWTPDNGLMLKATDMFINVCDKKIALNKEEERQLASFLKAYEQGQLKNFDTAGFLKEREKISSKSKQESQRLLEASIIVSNVLVSNQLDYSGELRTLGITEDQRRKLLRKVDEFEGEGFEGDVREGQTFLEASVISIRNILEDYMWDTLEG